MGVEKLSDAELVKLHDQIDNELNKRSGKREVKQNDKLVGRYFHCVDGFVKVCHCNNAGRLFGIVITGEYITIGVELFAIYLQNEITKEEFMKAFDNMSRKIQDLLGQGDPPCQND